MLKLSLMGRAPESTLYVCVFKPSSESRLNLDVKLKQNLHLRTRRLEHST